MHSPCLGGRGLQEDGPDQGEHSFAHARFFDFSGNRSLLRQRVLLFQGMAPHETNRLGAISFARGKKCGRAVGLYYIQAPKVSCIFSGGSHKPFTDYGVAACNLIRMLQAQDMLYADALSETNKVPLGSKNAFAALELCYYMQCMRKQLALQKWHRQQLTEVRRLWRRLPRLELWRGQYMQKLPRHRYFVVDGPNRMAKTGSAPTTVREGGLYHTAGGKRTAALREVNGLHAGIAGGQAAGQVEAGMCGHVSGRGGGGRTVLGRV